MSKRVLVASTIGAVAKSLGGLCENHGGQVTYFEQGKSLLRQLIDGKYEVLMLELNFIEGEHRDLIARLRSKNNFRICLLSFMLPSEMSKEEQARTNGVNAVLTAPFTDSKIVSLSNGLFPFPGNVCSSVLRPMMNLPLR